MAATEALKLEAANKALEILETAVNPFAITGLSVSRAFIYTLVGVPMFLTAAFSSGTVYAMRKGSSLSSECKKLIPQANHFRKQAQLAIQRASQHLKSLESAKLESRQIQRIEDFLSQHESFLELEESAIRTSMGVNNDWSQGRLRELNSTLKDLSNQYKS